MSIEIYFPVIILLLGVFTTWFGIVKNLEKNKKDIEKRIKIYNNRILICEKTMESISEMKDKIEYLYKNIKDNNCK